MASPPAPIWFDLTLPVASGMPVYPGDPPVRFQPHSSLDANGFQVTAVRLGTHSGTHLDAPSHFLTNGATVESLALHSLVGPARVIDAWDVPAGGVIERGRVGRIRQGERLIIRTGWSEQFGKAAYYEEFPSLAENLIADLAEHRIALIGLETPSVCADHAADAAAHRLLLGAGVVIVEGLAGLAPLPEQIWLIALPLRLEGLDGAPCRVIASLTPPFGHPTPRVGRAIEGERGS